MKEIPHHIMLEPFLLKDYFEEIGLCNCAKFLREHPACKYTHYSQCAKCLSTNTVSGKLFRECMKCEHRTVIGAIEYEVQDLVRTMFLACEELFERPVKRWRDSSLIWCVEIGQGKTIFYRKGLPVEISNALFVWPWKVVHGITRPLDWPFKTRWYL